MDALKYIIDFSFLEIIIQRHYPTLKKHSFANVL